MTTITIDRALLEQALEALEACYATEYDGAKIYAAKLALRAALAAPDDIAAEMSTVADQYAHKLALDLECVLADYSGTWYDTAIGTLGAYRGAMNAIHERESPTFMGEPVIRPTQAAPATVQLRQGECWPEGVMKQWDCYRDLIANGDTSSAPRDWFESLAEMRLVAAPATDDRHRQELLAQDITIANMAERHAQELCAYELTVQNLRAELAGQKEPITLEQFRAIAHRTATTYRHRIDPEKSSYAFVDGSSLDDFWHKVCEAIKQGGKP